MYQLRLLAISMLPEKPSACSILEPDSTLLT